MTTQATALSEPTVINGVNVTALGETIEAVQGNKDIATFQFRAKNIWMGGDHNRTTIEGFYGACDENMHAKGPFMLDNAEPPVLLGEGEAPNPVEFILHALAGCLTTSMVYHAAARGMKIEAIRSEIEGDLDLRGFLGLSEKVRKGFEVIRVKMFVKSEAKASDLAALSKYSPVYDIVSNSLTVDVEVVTY